VRRLLEPQLLQDEGAGVHQVAEVAIGLPEVLAERQQYDVLVIAVEVICVLRSAARVSRSLENPLLPSYDANEFYLAIAFPILRHEAIPSPGPWSLA
jgi:hypothetical protein